MSWELGTSAGEMESEWAGTPARVIRERYRRAADIAKVRGKCVPIPQARGIMVAVQEMHTMMNTMLSSMGLLPFETLHLDSTRDTCRCFQSRPHLGVCVQCVKEILFLDVMLQIACRLSCLLINDIDAGIGVFANTQRTVRPLLLTQTAISSSQGMTHFASSVGCISSACIVRREICRLGICLEQHLQAYL